MLEDHADLGALAGDLALGQLVELASLLPVADELPVDREAAGVDLLEVIDAAQERRLARARRAEHAHHLAALDLERDPLQDLELAEALVHALGLDHRLAHPVSVTGGLPRLPSQRARIVTRCWREKPRP